MLDDRVLRGSAERPTVEDIHAHVFGRKTFGEYCLDAGENGCGFCLSKMDELIGRRYKHEPKIIEKWQKIKSEQLARAKK